jgi:glyoxylase-like metal-dependent hydrolase (beta-lactamase superfamily II)
VWDAQGIPVWIGRGDEGWLAAPAPFNPALFGNPPPTPGVTPAAILEDGDTITCGDLALRIIAAPGHSPGCQVAYHEASGQALVGDLIFAMGIGRTDFPGSNHDDMVRSLARVFDELPGETVIYPGHDRWGVTLAQAEPYARMFM